MNGPEKVSKLVNQAKDFVALLENIPVIKNRKDYTNDKILEGLKSIGVATVEQVERLEKRVAELEAQLSKKKPVNNQ